MNSHPEPKPGHLPAWARADVFPAKPIGAAYGFVTRDGEFHEVSGRDSLIDVVKGKTKQTAHLVWIKEADHCVVPEEVEWLREAVLSATLRSVGYEYDTARKTCFLFGAIFFYFIYQAYERYGPDIRGIFSSPNVAGVGLLFTIFAAMPMYEAWKARRKYTAMKSYQLEAEVPEARFELWMSNQKAPVTRMIWIGLAIVALVQLFVTFQISLIGTINAAALVKDRVVQGEWWRYMTAPFMHGHPVHWMFNASALWFLGKRVETLARWPHVLVILAVSGWAGGVLSVTLRGIYPQPSVGASGAIVGLLGFLIVFEIMHAALVPRSARRRLFAAVGGLVLIGLVGVQMIDNAAHAGGLIAGILYGLIVFPMSKSVHRPQVTELDRIVGLCAGGLILGGGAYSILKLIAAIS